MAGVNVTALRSLRGLAKKIWIGTAGDDQILSKYSLEWKLPARRRCKLGCLLSVRTTSG